MVPRLVGQVLRLLEAELAEDGFELLDVRIFQGGGRFQVRIYVDLPAGGITLDRCTEAARTVNMLLEDADLFPGQYVIEVSSPGIRRPLRKITHFEAALGQKVELKLKPGTERTRIRGVLQAVEGTTLVVLPLAMAGSEEAPAALRVDLESVAEGNLDAEFDAQSLINADRRRRKEEKREERREKGKKTRKSRPKAGKTAGKSGPDGPTEED